MPIAITQTTPPAPVPMAKSPEYQKLQQYINETKLALDDISRQLVAIEAKYPATPRAAGQPATPPQTVATQPRAASTSGPATPVPNPATPDTNENFEDSIAEMRRIAGIK